MGVHRPFVVLESNREAFAAVADLVDNLETGRPLVLVGPSGTGKTHLANAFCRVIDGDSVHASAQALLDQYRNAIRRDQVVEFRRPMVRIPGLVIEHLEDLAGLEFSWDELNRWLEARSSARRPTFLTVTASGA